MRAIATALVLCGIMLSIAGCGTLEVGVEYSATEAVEDLAASADLTSVGPIAETPMPESRSVSLSAADIQALADSLDGGPGTRTVLVFPASYAATLADHLDYEVVPLAVDPNASPTAIKGALAIVLPLSGPVDVVIVRSAAVGAPSQLSSAIEQRLYRWDDTQTLGALERHPFVAGPETPELKPIGAAFQGGVELVAGSVLDDLEPGAPLRLALDWRINQPSDDSLVMFAHLMHEGQLVAQWDAVPGNGLFPVEGWEPGQVVRDQFALQVPAELPPGDYEVQVGTYSSTSGERRGVLGQDGVSYVAVETFRIADSQQAALPPAPAPTPTDAPLDRPAGAPTPAPTTHAPASMTPIPDAPASERSSKPPVRYPSLNDVRGLAFGPDGGLWAATGSGVLRWDLETGTFARYADDLVSTDVLDLAFAADGTLWIATRGGVSRFTGGGWTGYTRAQGLPSEIVSSVAAGADGTAWVGTQEGAAYFDGEKWSTVPVDPLVGQVVWYVAVAADGQVWFSPHGGGPVRYRPADGDWALYGEADGLPLPNPRALAMGPDGMPWLHVGYDNVYRFDGSSWRLAYPSGGGQWVCDIAFAPDGSPWIATCDGYRAIGSGLAYLDGEDWRYASTGEGLADNDILALAVAADGTVAAGTDRGISIGQGGQWRTLRSGPALSELTAVAVAGDGAVWFGFGNAAFRPPGGGLTRFDGQSWQYVTGADGFPISDNVRALAVAPDGALWAGAGCGLARLAPEQLSSGAHGWRAVATCDDLHGNVHTIAFAPDGTAWVATDFALYQLGSEGPRAHEVGLPISLAVDVGGIVWVGHSPLDGGRLSTFDGQDWAEFVATPPLQQPITALAATGGGVLWAGAREGGLARLDGDAWQTFSASDGLPSERVMAFAVAPDGVLWAITDAGLARFDGEAWQGIAVDTGAASINGMAFAPGGSIWLATSQGAVYLDPPGPMRARSMKGYELYSWEANGDWRFVLLPGTNRIKTPEEVLSARSQLRGLDALGRALAELSSGEQIFWLTHRLPNASRPPDDLIEEVRSYCAALGLQLGVVAS